MQSTMSAADVAAHDASTHVRQDLPNYRATNGIEWAFTGQRTAQGEPLYLEAHLNPADVVAYSLVPLGELRHAVGPLTRV